MTDAPHPLLKPHVYIFDFQISGQHCPTKFVLLRDYDEALAQAQRETWEEAMQVVIEQNEPWMHRNDFANKLIGYFDAKAQEQP